MGVFYPNITKEEEKVNTEVFIETSEQDDTKEVSDVQEVVVETETKPVENAKPERSIPAMG